MYFPRSSRYFRPLTFVFGLFPSCLYSVHLPFPFSLFPTLLTPLLFHSPCNTPTFPSLA
jgi:hypothetical protein